MSSKSVRDGSIPGWMKSQTETRLSLDELGSMSPPAHDESFFYIRLPTIASKKVNQTPQFSEQGSGSPDLKLSTFGEPEEVSGIGGQTLDFSQECKKYIAGLENATHANLTSTKPKGTDDDFKTAACAGSLVKVAQKFVGGTGKQLTKRFTVAKIDDDHAAPTEDVEDHFRYDPNLMQRRNSRSLPTSPLTSPKTMRKFQPQPNPYFTITGSDAPPPKQSWFLTSLFGVRRELTTSTMSVSSQIDEADEIIEPSSSSSNISPSSLEQRESPKKETGDVKPQPTLLREMNFWAPTSY